MKVDRANKKLNRPVKRLSFAFGLLLCNILPAFAQDNSVDQDIDEASVKPAGQSLPVKGIEPPAQDSKPNTNKPEASPAEPEKKDIGKKTAHFVTHLPQRLGLFTANVVVAAPAICVRRTVQYTASNTKELVGDHKNPVLLLPAGVLSSYYGLTSGLVEGTTFGVINSWKHSADGHISKASLGLEDK